MGTGSPEGDPAAGDHEAGRRPGPEGMPKSNAGDHRSAEAHIPDAAAGPHDSGRAPPIEAALVRPQPGREDSR